MLLARGVRELLGVVLRRGKSQYFGTGTELFLFDHGAFTNHDISNSTRVTLPRSINHSIHMYISVQYIQVPFSVLVPMEKTCL